MDPFSGIASAVGLIDVLWRVGNYLNDVKDATGRIEEDINILRDEIGALTAADHSIEDLRKTVQDAGLESQINHTSAAKELWNKVEQNRESCKGVLLKLEEMLKYIIGEQQKTKATPRDEIKGALGIQSTDAEKVKAEVWDATNHTSGKAQHTVRGKIDGLRKTLRRQSTDPELARIHTSLDKYQHILQALLAALNMLVETFRPLAK
jgi:prefoldin subunit 5